MRASPPDVHDVRWLALMIVAGLSVLVAGCDQGNRGQDLEELRTALEEVANREVRRAEINDEAVGGVVLHAATPDGNVTVAGGPATVAGDRELTGDEAFRVGSITKMLTATAALQLAEEGAVDLDAPVAELLRDRTALFEHGGDVTLGQLLGHTAGLPEYLGTGVDELVSPYAADLRDLADVDDGVAILSCDVALSLDPLAYAADGEAAFPPGTGYEYSNTGYQLAGEVVEAAAGRPLEEVYRTRILEPLGMEDTWLDCAEDARTGLADGLHPPAAGGLVLPGQGTEPYDVTDLLPSTRAAGGLVSTAEDLAVFARGLLSGDLFDDEATLQRLLEPGPEPSYGLGVALRGDTVGHDGSLPGYTADLRYDRDRDLTLVVLSNQTAPSHMSQPAPRAGEQAWSAITGDANG